MLLVFLLDVSQLSINVILAKSEPSLMTIYYVFAFACMTIRMLHAWSNLDSFIITEARLDLDLQL